MIYQAHRGVSTQYPENTMPAFRAAYEQGYQIIETDPAFTADGVCVLFHDKTVGRTCRGAAPERLVAEMTWEQLRQLDAGLYMGQQFAGTRVPLLEEALAYMGEKRLHVKLDNKFERFTPEQRAVFFDIVEKSGADAGITCAKVENIGAVAARFPNAVIHYDGYVDEKVLKAVQAQLKNNPLVVWLPLPSPLTSWVKVPMATPALCETVKRYGKLGLWILETEQQLAQAKAFGADIIETTGTLKPTHKWN